MIHPDKPGYYWARLQWNDPRPPPWQVVRVDAATGIHSTRLSGSCVAKLYHVVEWGERVPEPT